MSVRAIRQLERIEANLGAERSSRVDDLAVLVDLISAGWRTVDERLARIEELLGGDERLDVIGAQRLGAGRPRRRAAATPTPPSSAEVTAGSPRSRPYAADIERREQDRRAGRGPGDDRGEQRQVAKQHLLRLLAGAAAPHEPT